MKNLVLILILANVLYWMYAMFTEKESAPGVAVLQESDLGPPLEVAIKKGRDSVASVGAVLGSGEPSALSAVIGRACVTVGPFTEDADADSAVLEYRSEGMRTARRKARAEMFVGHWVQIRNVANDDAAKAMVAQLHAGGLTDAYKVVTEDEGIKISLGLFGDLEGAEKIELEALSLNLPAEITPRTSEREVYYVDIGLPPGRGAVAIVQKFGEERVHLRDAATCPR